MKNVFTLIISALFILLNVANAQVLNKYDVEIKNINISGFGGLQSFAFGQDNGNWVLIGGRTDGLHRRQPNFSFDPAHNNTFIYVINPVQSQVWSTSLSALPTDIQEQLQSTNMQFYQRKNVLYITGGYGYSAMANDHITYNKLTAVNIPQLIAAIKNNQSITNSFRQISTPYIQLTGGQLGYTDSIFYLIGGHKFMGRYNPNNGPSFIQEYSYAIRKFKINDDGTNLSISDTNSTIDVPNLRRRDYNLLPQIFQNGAKGFSVFAGVFQDITDLPYLNMIDVTHNGHTINNNITIHYNHYHCAKVAMFDSVNNSSENIFFGGISQFYDSSNVLIQDDDVPFVKTIGLVKRDAMGNVTETKIGEMPFLLGTSSEFIPNHAHAHYEGEIIKSHELSGDSVLIGHIVGGIESSAKNIFFINTGTQSSASSRIFEVWLKKKKPDNTNEIMQNEGINQIQFYPNPTSDGLKMNYFVKKIGNVSINISNQQGAVVYKESWTNKSTGHHTATFDLDLVPGVYTISLTDSNAKLYSQLFIKSE